MEKAVISFLKGSSALIYVLIFCVVLSVPAVFIYQAFLPPVFTFDSVSAEEEFTGDEVISEEDAESWQRVQLSLTATAGKFSPYSFYIEEFALETKALPDELQDVKIVLDEPVSCDKDTNDPFTITLYIKGETDINGFMNSVSFTASDYTKSFGEFKLKFEDGKAQFFKK